MPWVPYENLWATGIGGSSLGNTRYPSQISRSILHDGFPFLHQILWNPHVWNERNQPQDTVVTVSLPVHNH